MFGDGLGGVMMWLSCQSVHVHNDHRLTRLHPIRIHNITPPSSYPCTYVNKTGAVPREGHQDGAGRHQRRHRRCVPCAVYVCGLTRWIVHPPPTAPSICSTTPIPHPPTHTHNQPSKTTDAQTLLKPKGISYTPEVSVATTADKCLPPNSCVDLSLCRCV